MAVVEVDIHSREPYADGREFGSYGPMVRIDGVLHYAVDPSRSQNVRIVDLKLAPCESDGTVRFHGDFTLIAPTSSTARNLLLEVPNRGRHVAFGGFDRARPQDLLEDPCSPGDGFLFRHGFAVAAIGWQFDAEGMQLHVPEALSNGRRIRGQVICQMQPGRVTRSLQIAQLGPVRYDPIEIEGNAATLYERKSPQAPFRVVSRNSWRFGRYKGDEFEDSLRHISLDGGFSAGTIYTLVYEAEGAPVVGLGLLALRDAGAFLKSSAFPWPTDPPRRAIAYGASQTGRVLRHLIYEGLNESETGEEVFEGLLPHIAGGQRGDFNHRFAQPSTVGIPSCGQKFPFAGRTVQDPLTDVEDGLYARCTSPPKVISTNTSWEYWRGDAALTHTLPDGSDDCELLPNERSYFFAGTHHINAVFPSSDRFYLTNERVRYPMNMVYFTPLLRAALINLRDWIEGIAEPPESRIPSIREGSLVSRAKVVEAFRSSGRFEHLVDPDQLPGLFVTDLGSRSVEGVCIHPAQQGPIYSNCVADVGTDLNERAGIRLPEVALGIGVHTGWNPRLDVHGAPEQLATFAGFSVFNDAASAVAPESRRTEIETIARELIADRYVLEEDFDLVVSNALRLEKHGRSIAELTPAQN